MEEPLKRLLCGRCARRVELTWSEEIKALQEENATLKKNYLDLMERSTERLNELEHLKEKAKRLEEYRRELEETNKDLKELNKRLKGNTQVFVLKKDDSESRNKTWRGKKMENVYETEEETIIDYSPGREESSVLREQLNEKIRSEFSLHTKINEMEETIQLLQEKLSEEIDSGKQKDYQIVQLHIEMNAVEEKNDELVQENGQIIASLFDKQDEFKRQVEVQQQNGIVIRQLQAENVQLLQSRELLTKEKWQLEEKVKELTAYTQSVEGVFEKFRVQCGAREGNALQMFGFISDFISSRFSTLEKFCDKMEKLERIDSSLEKEIAKPPFPKHEKTFESSVESVTVLSPAEDDPKRRKLDIEGAETLTNGKKKAEDSYDKEKVDADLKSEINKLTQRNKSLVKDKRELEGKVKSLTSEVQRFDKVFHRFRAKDSKCKWKTALDLFTHSANKISYRRISKGSQCDDKITKFNSPCKPDPETRNKVLREGFQMEVGGLSPVSTVSDGTEEPWGSLPVIGQSHLERELEEELVRLKQQIETLEAEKQDLKHYNNLIINQKIKLERKALRIDRIFKKLRAMCEPGEIIASSALELFTFIAELISTHFPSMDKFSETVKDRHSLEEANMELKHQLEKLQMEEQDLKQKINALSGDKANLEMKITSLIEQKCTLDRQVTVLTDENVNLQEQYKELIAQKLQVDDKLHEINEEKLQLTEKVEILTGKNEEFEAVFRTFRSKCTPARDQETSALELFTFIANLISSRFSTLEDFQAKLEKMCDKAGEEDGEKPAPTVEDPGSHNGFEARDKEEEFKFPGQHEIIQPTSSKSEATMVTSNYTDVEIHKQNLDSTGPEMSNSVDTNSNEVRKPAKEGTVAVFSATGEGKPVNHQRSMTSQVIKISYVDSDNDEEIDVDD